jgi:hypothetical protein
MTPIRTESLHAGPTIRLVPLGYRTRRRERDGLEEAKKIEVDTEPSDQAAWHVPQSCIDSIVRNHAYSNRGQIVL